MGRDMIFKVGPDPNSLDERARRQNQVQVHDPQDLQQHEHGGSAAARL
jgi:hypothetical protein